MITICPKCGYTENGTPGVVCPGCQEGTMIQIEELPKTFKGVLMKNVFIALVLGLSACGTQDKSETEAAKCDQPLTGIWQGVTVKDSLSISNDLAFQYVGSDACKSTGVIAACPTGGTGSMKVTINSASAGACNPAGDYIIGYTISGSQLSIQSQTVSTGKIGTVFVYKK